MYADECELLVFRPFLSSLSACQKSLFDKLAYFLKHKKAKKVLLVAGDVYRPAAIDQLKVLGEQIQVDVFSEEGNTHPVDIAKKAVSHAKEYGYQVVIVDTAGRLSIDQEMMDQKIEEICQETNKENRDKLDELYCEWYKLPRSYMNFDAFE